MTTRTILSLLLSVLSLTAGAQSQEQLLLSGWRFQRGPQTGAEAPGFDDSRWQAVTIPHDWAIAGPFDKDIDKQVVAIVQDGEKQATEKTGRSGALPWIGEGWYRTTITIPTGYAHAELVFDGAMAEPTIYIDGRKAGYWAYGYSTFRIDITPFLPQTDGALKAGRHTLSVHLKNVEESSRWYPGAGLYRPVRLLLSQNTAIKTFGIFARNTMLEGINGAGTTASDARLTVTTQLRRAEGDKKKYTLRQRLLDAQGKVVANVSTESGNAGETTQVMAVKDVSL